MAAQYLSHKGHCRGLKVFFCSWGRDPAEVLLRQMVWAVISSKGIIGPFFGEHTMNAAKYLKILNEFVAIHDALVGCSNASWFMHDGAHPHWMTEIFDFLSKHFNDRVNALDYNMHIGSGMTWHPYSPDIWCYVTFFFGGGWGMWKKWYTAKFHKQFQNWCNKFALLCETIPADMFS